MELIELNCPRCNYKADLLIGTQDPGQTFSDLNEDFAYYKLFLCQEGKELHSIDINFREFNGNCPQHTVKLQSLQEVPKTCPKCGGPIQVTKKDILKAERGE